MEESRKIESTGPAAATVRPADEGVSDAIWTVPNLISMVRIGLIAIFGWLLIAGHDLWAVAALAAAAASDFLDGFLARRWGQVTVLGRMLDPAADRLLTVVVIVALALRGVVPWWLVVVLLARDAMVATALIIGRASRVPVPQVTFAGKAATAALYLFLPLAFLAYGRWEGVHMAAIGGAVLAAGLYWLSGIGYVRDVARRVRSQRVGAAVSPRRERLG